MFKNWIFFDCKSDNSLEVHSRSLRPIWPLQTKSTLTSLRTPLRTQKSNTWPIFLNIVIHLSQELMLRHRLEKKIQNSGLSGGFTSHYVSYRRSSKKAFQRNTFRILAFWIVTLSELEESYLVLTKLNYSMCECRRDQLFFAKDCQIFSPSVQLSYFKKVWRIAKKI